MKDKPPTINEYRGKVLCGLVTRGFDRHFGIKAVGFYKRVIEGMYYSSYNPSEVCKFIVKDLVAIDPSEIYGGMLDRAQLGDRKVA